MWPYNLQQTYELVRQIAAEVFGHVPHGEPVFLARGSNNAAFEIDIDDGRRFVIRVTGEWRERTTRQERWCYGHAQRLGIPSPEVVAIGKLEKLPYIVLTYVEGTGGVESAIDRRQLWSTLGRYGRLINSVETGELSMIEDDRPLYPEPRTQWFQWLDAAERNFLVEGGTFSEHERDTIRTLLKELRGRPFQFGLSHGDLDLRNTIVSDLGVIHLIDYSCSLVSLVPQVDLYNILREQRSDSEEISGYLVGYGLTQSAFAKILPEVRAFGLVQQLKDVDWAFGERPDLIPRYTAAVSSTVQNHLQVMQAALMEQRSD